MCESNDLSSTSGGSNSNDSVASNGEAQLLLDQFWPNALEEVLNLENHDFKNQELPLARIKRIMKLDDDAAMMMISGEAPVLFAKAAELFISELTLRSWIHTENNKRRTLQRNDIAMATSKYDQFDFLIDIVPREELQKSHNQATRQHVDTTSIQLSELPANAQIITPIEGMPFETLTQDQFQAYIQMSQNQMNGYSTMEMTPQITNPSSELVNEASQYTTFTYNNPS